MGGCEGGCKEEFSLGCGERDLALRGGVRTKKWRCDTTATEEAFGRKFVSSLRIVGTEAEFDWPNFLHQVTWLSFLELFLICFISSVCENSP